MTKRQPAIPEEGTIYLHSGLGIMQLFTGTKWIRMKHPLPPPIPIREGILIRSDK